MQIPNVGALIEHLKTFDPNALLTFDVEGNTWPVLYSDIQVWNENDPESPVAIFCE